MKRHTLRVSTTYNTYARNTYTHTHVAHTCNTHTYTHATHTRTYTCNTRTPTHNTRTRKHTRSSTHRFVVKCIWNAGELLTTWHKKAAFHPQPKACMCSDPFAGSQAPSHATRAPMALTRPHPVRVCVLQGLSRRAPCPPNLAPCPPILAMALQV